ncbi:MAG: hypothetical protein ACRD0B_00465, partial [Acidimicrobiales bacterium]
VAQLDEGRIAPEAFRHKIQSWRPIKVLGPPEVAGVWRFEADPGRAEAASEVERAEGRTTWIDSGRRRPPQRRRR